MTTDVVQAVNSEPTEPSVVLDDVSTEQANEPAAAPVVDSEVEREARDSGWVPQEQWKGDPAKWRDAATYVDARNHVLPIVQKENRALREKLAAMEARLARLDQVEQERAKERERLSVDTLKIEAKQAFDEQDYARAQEINEKLIDAKLAAIKPQPAQPQVDPATNEIWVNFVNENQVFKDENAAQVLVEKMVLMRQAGSKLLGREMLEAAKDRVRREYPEYFPQRRPMAESGGVNGAQRGTTKTWNDVKPEYRQALEKMIEDTPGLDRAAILKRCAANPTEYFR